MSLRVQCVNCGRDLDLDAAFLGAHCRCQYCRSLMSIPTNLSSEKTTAAVGARPTRPALIGERTPSRRTAARATQPSRGPTWAGLSSRARIGAAALAIVLVATVSLRYGAFPTARRSTPIADKSTIKNEISDQSVADAADPKANLRAANPITHLFGIPLSGKTIGCVVDGDATMAPYIDSVATVTNAVFAAVEKGTRRFGVLLAVEHDGNTVVEAVEPSTDLEGARAILVGRLASGRTDLSKALSVASNWYADEIFLVLSKPVDDRQMEILKQSAEQTSAVVHVIALGGAADQDLSPIAKATGGTFVAVADDELKQLVDRQNQAKSVR
jgi:hypothetical protein